MDISIVVPLYNEEESLIELFQWIKSSLNPTNYSFEIIFIDDGSSDKSWKVIKDLSKEHQEIKGLRFIKNYGKSQALNAGFKLAKGQFVGTLDADLQDSPEELPSMIKKLIDEDLDLVSGWKKTRYDNFIFKNLPSIFFNFVVRKVSGIKLHDFNCGIKVYKKNVVKTIDVSGEMHRYIPFLASQAGFKNISEKEVKHQIRKYGVTKFGPERFLNGFLDLTTLWFLNKFGKRPMHFFGLLGSFMFFIGISFTLFLGVDKLYYDINSRLITDRPEFFISLVTIIVGIQFFIAGFIGELLLKQRSGKKNYFISHTISND